MREIKFKYYCSQCNVWHIATLDRLTDPKALDFRVCHNEGYNASGFKEYTGLKDKHGVEIWERDLVVTDSTGAIPQYNGRIPREVYFYNGRFCFDAGRNHPTRGERDDINFGYWAFGDGNIEHIEVIGNVFQHPHLIEEAK